MKRLALIAIAALATACGGGGHTINGQLVLHDADSTKTSTDCTGSSGYNDIHHGTTVVVKDGSGTIIGTGSLTFSDNFVAGECHYIFSVPVKDAEFYSVEISRRGGLTYSRADLEANGWEADADLGSS